MSYGRWGGGPVPSNRQGTVNKSSNVKIKEEGETQEYNHSEFTSKEKMLAGLGWVSVALTVGRSAQYGSEKLEARVESGLPCSPDEESRLSAISECTKFITEKAMPIVIGTAFECFDFAHPHMKGILKEP